MISIDNICRRSDGLQVGGGDLPAKRRHTQQLRGGVADVAGADNRSENAAIVGPGDPGKPRAYHLTVREALEHHTSGSQHFSVPTRSADGGPSVAHVGRTKPPISNVAT